MPDGLRALMGFWHHPRPFHDYAQLHCGSHWCSSWIVQTATLRQQYRLQGRSRHRSAGLPAERSPSRTSSQVGHQWLLLSTGCCTLMTPVPVGVCTQVQVPDTVHGPADSCGASPVRERVQHLIPRTSIQSAPRHTEGGRLLRMCRAVLPTLSMPFCRLNTHTNSHILMVSCLFA
jgi:hypothetical protein